MGAILAGAVGAVWCGAAWMFTPDAAVQLAVRQLAPVGMLTMAVCCGEEAWVGEGVTCSGSGRCKLRAVRGPGTWAADLQQLGL